MSLEMLLEEIRAIPVDDRKKLIGMIIDTLTEDVPVEQPVRGERSILELSGLGAEIWQGIDAQAYIRQMRDEWDDEA